MGWDGRLASSAEEVFIGRMIIWNGLSITFCQYNKLRCKRGCIFWHICNTQMATLGCTMMAILGLYSANILTHLASILQSSKLSSSDFFGLLHPCSLKSSTVSNPFLTAYLRLISSGLFMTCFFITGIYVP